MTALFALGSALTYGVADFLGGRVASRAPALTVGVATQAFGLLLVLALAPLLGGELTGRALWSGALAGIAGASGLVVYFRALAVGPMGVVAPLAGAVGAVIPVGVGVLAGERVGLLAVFGIALGLVAVVLSSLDRDPAPAPAGAVRPARRRLRDVVRPGEGLPGPLLGAVSGVLFGFFFVLLDMTPESSGMWPLVGARLTTVPLLTIVALLRGRAWPGRTDMGAVALSGALDIVANALFLLAARTGLLVLSGLLVSLYPVVIVLLARQVLGERLDRVQQAGVGLALVAVTLVSLG